MRIEIKPRTKINAAVDEAVAAAESHGERCEFTFNGDEVYADPGEYCEAVLDRWVSVCDDPMCDLQADPNRKILPQNPDAFPCASDVNGHASGMTLRDYFAAKALQGMLAGGGDYDKPAGAQEAYEWADAMLAAR